MTDLERFQHPRFARAYERVSRESDARGTAGHRARLLETASGRVIETWIERFGYRPVRFCPGQAHILGAATT